MKFMDRLSSHELARQHRLRVQAFFFFFFPVGWGGGVPVGGGRGVGACRWRVGGGSGAGRWLGGEERLCVCFGFGGWREVFGVGTWQGSHHHADVSEQRKDNLLVAPCE